MLEFLEKPGLIIVLLVALIVFGSKRLPDSARSLGRSMRILKAEAKGLKDDDAPSPAPMPSAAAQPVQQSALPPVSYVEPIAPVMAGPGLVAPVSSGPAPVAAEQPEQRQP